MAARRWDRDDMEPRVREILDRKLTLRAKGPYAAKTDPEVIQILTRAFESEGLRDIRISDLERMAGGASKEQFAFTLQHAGSQARERFVLRMDPYESIAQTCRGREAQIQAAMEGFIPVAPVRYFDADGRILGQPGLITRFVAGVTAPSDVDAKGVSGMGSRYDAWAAKLAPQFIEYLAKIHQFDWRDKDLSYFQVPPAGTNRAPLQVVNWWSKVWWDDVVEPVPVVTLAERWLRLNAPVCDKPVVVHGDFRIGNFMFEEPSGRFTAVLDWELCHFGDFHEDIAWATQKLFGAWRDDGVFLVCGLLPRQEFMDQYAARSGNRIDPAKLRYYEILNAYKCAVMDLAVAVRAPMHGTNHQDLVLTWLGSAGAVFLDHIIKLIREANDAAQH